MREDGAVTAEDDAVAVGDCGFAAVVRPGGPVRVRMRRCCVAALITADQFRCAAADLVPPEEWTPDQERPAAAVGAPS